jgi:Xaa-Pro aminopeptidase
MTELEAKLQAINGLLDRLDLDALFLRRVSSFAWATCGAASYVNTAASEGAASLLITRDKRYLITDNIEATRLEQEEQLSGQGWELKVSPWHTSADVLSQLTKGLQVGADGDLPGMADLSMEVARLRSRLTPQEGERFRQLGRLCAEGMEAACRSVRPGQTEYQVAAMLARETQQRGVQPIVNLIASDDRIYRFRHPLPTGKSLERYLMLVLCGRRQGLVCSLTRLVHFGQLPDEVRRKAEAVAWIDAAFINITRPGRSLGEVFEAGIQAYAETGFSAEWQMHHQGGPAGYEPREYLAYPGSEEVISSGQAFAWNPSISGAKSEDTILVGTHENEALTEIRGWPTMRVQVDGSEFLRPAVWEVS